MDCFVDRGLVILAASAMRIPGFVAGKEAMTAVPVYRVLMLISFGNREQTRSGSNA